MVPDPSSFASRVASLLSASSDTASVAGFLEELARHLPVRGWLALWDPDQQMASWLPSGEGEPFPLRLADRQASVLHEALRNARSTLLPDVEAAEEFPEKRYLLKSGGCWAFLPIAVSKQAPACLILRAEKAGALASESLEVVKAAMPVVALFLRATMLQRELEARVEERTIEISLLYDLSRSLGFVLSPEDLFQLVGSALQRALTFDMCAFLLLLPDHREIAMHLSIPAEQGALRNFSELALAEMERISGQPPGRVPSTVVQPRTPTETSPMRAGEISSVAHVPLFIRGQVVGLLSVASRKTSAFGESEMRLMYTIANQASLTLDRIRTAREAEANKIHSMLESMAEGVLLLDGGLRVVMSNPAAQGYLRLIGGGRMPRTLRRLGEIRLSALLDTMESQGRKPRTFEMPVPGEGKIFSVTCSPVRGLQEAFQGMVVVISDVTEARALQIQFAQSEKLSALGEMISGVAHELNNPLASVMAHAQLLQTKDVDSDIRKKLAVIDAEASRCQRIVQNLLQFARRHTPERRPLNINSVLESVLQLLEHQLKVDDVGVHVELDPDLRPVEGDSHLLQQVFLNIIHNAYQAMKENGGPGELRVRTINREDRVIVEIADNGPGIAPDTLKRIFDPFFSTKGVGKGTGLGLSLAYGTVIKHEGRITATSRLGAGATFFVDLPALPTVAAARSAEISRVVSERGALERSPAGAPAPIPGPANGTGRRILVVEDEATLAEVVAEVLQSVGHHVDTAGDGGTAKALIGRVRYDLIISDLKMPHMNGREFYKHVASIQPALARRIIFSTGDTANPDTQAFFAEVGNPFLSKPFNLKELLRVVGSVLGEI